MLAEPGRNGVDVTDIRPCVIFELRVGREFGEPARHLPVQESIRLAEVGKSHRHMVDGAEARNGICHRQTHIVADICIGCVQGG